MSQELVKLETQTLVPSVDFGSKLFKLKPATIVINQRMTEAPGAELGKLRITDTGEQFAEMWVTLLSMPKESRNYNVGKIKTFDTLVCFSRDMIQPDPNSKVPQAIYCDSCDHSKWGEADGKKIPPACDPYYYAVFIDTVYKMPLQMFIKGISKKPFEAGTKNLARHLSMIKAKGREPNIYDIKFKLSTKLHTDNKTYMLNMSDFQIINDADRQSFGEIYNQYTNSNVNPAKQDAHEVQKEIEILEAEILSTNKVNDLIANPITNEDIPF